MTERNTLAWVLLIAFSLELLMLNQLVMLTEQWSWALAIFAGVTAFAALLIADINNENIENSYLQPLAVNEK